MGDMPGNGFALTIRVGRQKDFISLGGSFFQIGDNFTLAFNGDILRGKVLFYINAQLAYRQVTDVTDRSPDIIILAQVFFQGSGFCG